MFAYQVDVYKQMLDNSFHKQILVSQVLFVIKQGVSPIHPTLKLSTSKNGTVYDLCTRHGYQPRP